MVRAIHEEGELAPVRVAVVAGRLSLMVVMKEESKEAGVSEGLEERRLAAAGSIAGLRKESARCKEWACRLRRRSLLLASHRWVDRY